MKRFFIYSTQLMEARSEDEIVALISHAMTNNLGPLIEINNLSHVKLTPVTTPMIIDEPTSTLKTIGGIGKYGDPNNDTIPPGGVLIDPPFPYQTESIPEPPLDDLHQNRLFVNLKGEDT